MAVGDAEYYEKGLVSGKTRLEEFEKASKYYKNCSLLGVFSDRDRQLYDETKISDAIAFLDKHILEFRPTIIVFPASSHHQDHQFTYQASIAAVRPSPDTSFIKMFLIGTYPHYDAVPPSRGTSYFYCRLNKSEYENKLRSLSEYQSQLSDEDSISLLSAHSVSMTMQMRGVECSSQYAERYEIFKLIL